jgi:hypothetical protein
MDRGKLTHVVGAAADRKESQWTAEKQKLTVTGEIS